MNISKKITVNPEVSIDFNNNADFCIGTERMYVAMNKEYLDQLKLVQDKIGFKYIRGHGLFCDDMAICQSYIDESGKEIFEYNYTYIDIVMDNYKSFGLRPFIELGFMPEKLASGNQTVFYWKGNVTPPKNYEYWTMMVQNLLRHLIERYGEEEVLNWPIEVWNEPNLKIFWKDADIEEYFKLYSITAKAVKEVNKSFKIGGPAICGVEDEKWITLFLEFIRNNKVPLDFITRHHYTSEVPKMDGHYAYVKLHEIDEGFNSLEKTRSIVDSFEEFKGMEIHITEFNTSYVPNAPIHDTNLNAVYIAILLSRLGDKHSSYSYWTFGDIFEEKGIPFTPFHGGFGLVANGCIKKPTFWTFAFYKKLNGICVNRSENSIIIKMSDNNYQGIFWNLDNNYSGNNLDIELILPVNNGEYFFLTKTVDEECCNPLKLWHNMGEPSSLSNDQKELLIEHSKPLVKSENYINEKSEFNIKLQLTPNALVYFELTKIQRKSDRGYSYSRIIKGENNN